MATHLSSPGLRLGSATMRTTAPSGPRTTGCPGLCRRSRVPRRGRMALCSLPGTNRARATAEWRSGWWHRRCRARLRRNSIFTPCWLRSKSARRAEAQLGQASNVTRRPTADRNDQLERCQLSLTSKKEAAARPPSFVIVAVTYPVVIAWMSVLPKVGGQSASGHGAPGSTRWPAANERWR